MLDDAEQAEAMTREAFAILDRDADGIISAQELKMMMQKLGNPLTDAEVKDIIKEAGSASTNSITITQFQKLMGSTMTKSTEVDAEEEMRAAFKLFDKDNDGQISPKEMSAALAIFGITLSDRETDLLIAEATLTSGGARQVSYEVFKKVMLTH